VPLETLTGPALPALLKSAEARLGPEAQVIQTRSTRGPDGQLAFEVVAADPRHSRAAYQAFLHLQSLPALRPLPHLPLHGREHRPYVIALVGPTGSGKTTTLAKVATHPRVFGPYRTGLLTLDTYRVGAVEQLQAYAEIAQRPIETVYESREIRQARRRLGDCDVVLVDTPGRGPAREDDREAVQRSLDLLYPDEIHLVLPAGLRPELARERVQEYLPLGVTHMLATKLDEVPGDTTLFDLAVESGLPMRWITDGQRVPTDLRPARPALLAALLCAQGRAHLAEARP
jgi:flagellar biosynthesis protein FlhF